MTTTFITGCSTGIGQACALYFARQGHHVFATMRNPQSGGESLQQAAAAESLRITLLPLDVDDQGSVDAAAREAIALGGVPDIVINNAGIGAGSAVEETSIETYKQVMETNFFGALRVTKAFVAGMRERGSGSIVNVTSVAGRLALGNASPYASSKWALEGASESLAIELRRFGVRVIVVEPGVILTPIFNKGERPNLNSPYAHLTRQHMQFFAARLADPGLPHLVAEVIDRALTDPEPKLRYPAGWDAEGLVAGRSNMTDEEWVDTGLITDPDEYAALSVSRFGVNIAQPAPAAP